MEDHRVTSNEQRATVRKSEARCSMLAFTLAALLCSCFLYLGAQDPGSLASRVQRPGTCGNGEVLTYNSTSQQYECQPGGSGVPAGAILLIVSGSCPSGYAEETALNGRLPLGTLAANADIGTTGGADNITPAGTNSTPIFSGSALAGHSHGVGSYAHATPTFTGNALATHQHELPFYKVSGGTGAFRTIPGSVFGTGTSRAAESTTTTAANTTSAAVALSQAISGGTPSGTVSNPAFSGSSSSDSAGTPAGTISTPTFTGTQFDNRSAFVRVIFCRKT